MKVILYGAPVVPFAGELPPRLTTDWEIVNVDDRTPRDAATAAFADADAVITVDYGREFPPAPKMKMVHVPGAGCDGILTDALPAGAALCNVHRHEEGVAEFAILAMLQCCVRYIAACQSFRNGSWERSSRFGAPPHAELSSKTVGIVGLGRIGRMVAKRCKAFGTRVVAAEYFDIAKPDEVDELYRFGEVAKVAAQSDFLVVCCALTDETRGMIDAAVFDAMPSSGVLINIARGPLVDEDALYEALSTGKIAAAAIDVWYQYPDTLNAGVRPSKYPFQDMANVYMTPHIAGWTQETVRRRWDFIAGNLDRVARGEEPENIVFRKPL
ncbi:2-hydroxyacid dehydrogenase [Shumkonia mesophila]|uniref:2-hydroxyacid dehydrogenase n=1 Tax=Shumkonia mesophila TaxID=2838854 RepID=UPI0029341E29|nr:2-hydroxyacid dehydrogenase [Shumkonia mesophila]